MNNFIEVIKKTERKPIFVDLNNALYRAYYSYKDIPNGHLIGLSQTLRTLDRLGFEVFLCEDSPCTYRMNLNEEYKDNRNSLHFETYYPEIRDLISGLEHFHTLRAYGYEADDIMFSASKICSDLKINNYISTVDKDLLQSLDEYTKVVHKITMSGLDLVDENSEYYTKNFPVPPYKLSIYRALKGDKSDNLKPPVARLPKDFIEDLVTFLYLNNGNLKGFIPKDNQVKWLSKLVENWDKFLNNYNIMGLKPIEFVMLDKPELNTYLVPCNKYKLNTFKEYVINVNAQKEIFKKEGI